MKINFNEITNISKKKDLKKYNINKPIFLNNYLFHYLILTGNLKGLKLAKYPIYQINNEYLNGFHLAAKLNQYKILMYLIKKYPEYCYNLTKNNENFIFFYHPSNKNFLKIILKNPQLDWIELLYNYSKKNICYLDIIFIYGSFKQIKIIITKFDFNWNKFKIMPAYFNILENDSLTAKEKINIFNLLKKKNRDILLKYDTKGYNIIFYLFNNMNLELIKYFYKNKVDLDIYTPLSTKHILKLSYQNEIDSIKYPISNFIWNKIKKHHNFLETNSFGDNLAHYILLFRINTKKGNYKLEKDILIKNNYWNIVNFEKNTPLHLLVQLDFDKYHMVLKNKYVDLTIKNEDNKTPLDLASEKWKKYLKSLPKIKIKKNNIKLIQGKFRHSTLFRSNLSCISIFILMLKNKYSQLYVPKYIKNYNPYINWDNGLEFPSKLIKLYLNFPWIIIWTNNQNYWIHPYLNQLINSTRKNNTHDYSFVILGMNFPNQVYHAEILLYDFKNLTIERFDPYGNTENLDSKIDYVLEEELTWNTGFSYIPPSKLMTVASLQQLANENNLFNTKPGDFGGFCLAWSLWFIEHKIINPSISSKILIRKTIDKIMKSEQSLIEYIRNYANNLNEYRFKFMRNEKIPSRYLSNDVLPLKYENKLFLSIIKRF